MSKRKRRLTISAIVLVALAILFWPAWWTNGTAVTISPGRAATIWLYGKIADHVLAHVELPLDFELPVTLTSYPSGPTTAAVIGGRGHGLDCSLPPGAGYAFRPLPDGAPVALRLRQACAFHDLCYRHGLATYGYQQNDCDELLQEHSFRICAYAFLDNRTLEECRLEAKKITLAVRLFGSDAFQGWDHSTFYEFDPFPIRTSHFAVARLLPRDDGNKASGLDLVRFDIDRVGIASNCIACGTQQKAGTASVIPHAREGVFSAPQLASTGNGMSRLAFAVRRSAAHTGIILSSGTWSSDAQKVSLSSRSDRLGDNPGSDLLGSTVYAFATPDATEGDAVAFVTPTIQCRDSNQKVALSSKQVGAKSRRCGLVAIDGDVRLGKRYQLFQHPLLLDAARHRAVLFKREHEADAAFDAHANILLIDFLDTAPYRARMLRKVALAEIHEPAFLLPDEAPTLLSLVGSQWFFTIVETPLDRDRAEPAGRALRVDDRDTSLPANWIERPPLLLRDRATTQLLLSRFMPSATAADGSEATALDLMLLQREARDSAPARWSSQAAMRCDVRYRIREVHQKDACAIPHGPNPWLPTMLNRLRGSQTLAGDMRGNGGTDVAIIDPCLPNNPIMFESTSRPGSPAWTLAAAAARVGDNLIREVAACRPLGRTEMMAAE